MEYIAFDAHKHYTLASVEKLHGGAVYEERIPHERGALRRFLGRCELGSPVAVEALGNWYWIVDEVEDAGFVPRLVHPRKAKLMVGMINKTDKLDARGLNRLQRAGTLPTVWIPPGELRDWRDLPRSRMVLVRQRTQPKNRIHATLAKYALTVPEATDLFGRQGRKLLRERLCDLPPQTAYAAERLLEQVEALDRQVRLFEHQMGAVFEVTPEIELAMTLPGVGFILATVIVMEVGDVARFVSHEKLAAYAGTVPRVHASGGARSAMAGCGRTSTTISSGRLSKRPTPSVACAGTTRIVMSAGSMSGWPGARDTKRPLGRWPGIWRRRRTGCSPSGSPTANPGPRRGGEVRCGRYRPRRRQRGKFLSPERLVS